VYFATDRIPIQGETLTFGSEVAENDSITCGVVEVSIPDTHKVGEMEGPGRMRWVNRDDPTDFIVVLSTRACGRDSMAADIRSLLSEAGREDVLVFVHGYCVSFEDAARRTAQLAYDLKFPGAPVCYSWASHGNEASYRADEDNVQDTVPHFIEFLRFVLSDLGAKDVHVVAHSMGNRALMRALSQFDVSTLPEGSARLRQIVMAAPDIGVDEFLDLAKHFRGKADRMTLYSSKRDKALWLSHIVNRQKRAGGSLTQVDGIDIVDASDAGTEDAFAHSYFGNTIIADLYAVIRYQAAPVDRFGTGRREKDGVKYWKLLKGAY